MVSKVHLYRRSRSIFRYFSIRVAFVACEVSRLHGHVQSDKSMEWNQEVVQRLKNIDNVVSRVVDFWLTILFSGFITEFVVDIVKAYSQVECQFFKGYRGKFLNSLNLWIKILLCDKGILKLRSYL